MRSVSKLWPMRAEFSMANTQRISLRWVGGPGVDTLWRGIGEAPPGDARPKAGDVAEGPVGVCALAASIMTGYCLCFLREEAQSINEASKGVIMNEDE